MQMSALSHLISEELAEATDPRVRAFAEHLAQQYGDAARAVLFYGSCLRSSALEGQMLDFYIIVSSYEEAYGKSWLVRANKLLPPNVFPAKYENLAAKYAVLSEEDFYALNREEARAVSVWARFSQPSRLLWAKDVVAKDRIVAAISGAAPTLLNAALAHIDELDGSATIAALWEKGYSLTYGAELRAERPGRSHSVVEFAPLRYTIFGKAVLEACNIKVRMDGDIVSVLPGQDAVIMAEKKRWPALRRNGKLLTLARLAKASGTYAGGIDYLAWKINRHAGTNYSIKSWQRRWPILGAVVMLPRLLRVGAIK